MTDSDIDKLVEVAAQENSPAARQRLFHTIRLAEVFAPCELDPHDPKKVRSTPLARLSDGTHAMMLFTSKSHPHLSEHQHFAGGAFKDHLSAALKMAPLDWVILSNSAWQRVAIHKQQIAAMAGITFRRLPQTARQAPCSKTSSPAVPDLSQMKCHTRSARSFESENYSWSWPLD